VNALVLAYFADHVRATAIAEANSATELCYAVVVEAAAVESP